MIRLISIIAFFLLLNACATFPPQSKDNSLKTKLSCQSFYTEFDKLIDDENIRDVQASILSDYPFLSVNRFLRSFKSELASVEKMDHWLSLLADLNVEARKIEWKNLSQLSQEKFSDVFLLKNDFNQAISSCSTLLLGELSDSDKQLIVDSAKVTDDYSSAQRFFGVYPVTSVFVSRQINKHQALTKEAFDKNLNEIPIRGRLIRYSLGFNSLSEKPSFDFDNPLKIPVLGDEQMNNLFVRYAPVIEVDEEDGNDVIGRIGLNDKGRPAFLADKAIFYVLPSYTRFNGEVLLQLNYVFWFSSRPRKSTFDIYSGKLDGLIWRVTLDHNGEPLMYDSVHDCGCYHKFYLTDKVLFKRDVAGQEREPPFIAQKNVTKKPLVLRIGSVAHFVNRVYTLESKAETKNIESNIIEKKSYAGLRSLANGNQRKSLFENDGLVSGTARAERWLLWPMGVPSAGAMRQWGHHAVAFVGKRYFDDSDLLDRYFMLKP